MISAVRGGEEVQIMAEVAVATVPTGGLVADRQTSRLASADASCRPTVTGKRLAGRQMPTSST